MQNSELLFYGGILIMSIAVIVMIISLIMFHITGQRIKKDWKRSMENLTSKGQREEMVWQE